MIRRLSINSCENPILSKFINNFINAREQVGVELSEAVNSSAVIHDHATFS